MSDASTLNHMIRPAPGPGSLDQHFVRIPLERLFHGPDPPGLSNHQFYQASWRDVERALKQIDGVTSAMTDVRDIVLSCPNQTAAEQAVNPAKRILADFTLQPATT